MKTETVTSAGGVVTDARGNVLMIARRSPKGELQWTLPKGLVEHDEDPRETAVREVGEETGHQAVVVGEPETIDYWFVWKPDATRYHKFVHYYPMRALDAPPGTRDDEAEAVEWVEPLEAVRRASFANERAVLEGTLGITARKTESAPKRRASSPRKRAGG